MQAGLMGIVSLLLVVMIILIIRLWLYRKQIKHISEELSIIAEEDTNYRLSSCCAIGKTEEIIQKMNQMLVRHREMEVNRKALQVFLMISVHL